MGEHTEHTPETGPETSPDAGRLARWAPRANRFEQAGEGLLLDGEAVRGPTHSEEDVHSPARLRWVLLAVAALGVVVLGLSRWQEGEPSPVRDDESDLALSNDKPDDQAEEESADTTAPAETESPSDPDSDDAISTTTDEENTEPDAEQATGPVLGEETGLGIILRSSSSAALTLLNLDTGQSYELSARGQLIGMLDGRIVLNRNGTLTTAGLDSQVSEGTEVITAAGGWVDVVALTEDEIWIIDQSNFDAGVSDEDVVVEAYDALGNKVAETPLDTSWFASGSVPNGELVQESGGGIYRLDGDGYARVSTGTLRVVGEELALARECDDRRRCSNNWYRQDDWTEPVDLPDPGLERDAWVNLVSGDRWLVETSWRAQKARIIGVETGRTVYEVRISEQAFNGPLVQSVALSEDGRWLLEEAAAGVKFIDLDTGNEFPHEPDLSAGTITGLFVDLADVGFLQ